MTERLAWLAPPEARAKRSSLWFLELFGRTGKDAVLAGGSASLRAGWSSQGIESLWLGALWDICGRSSERFPGEGAACTGGCVRK
ncbi:hypothetical protein ACGFY9_36425 [Streptomyces sp. NPDC048504]|uniref:hypothetical protein n=1 Tax=Streptomyces sp. NPDC048504 TaxID=3365559 RepID=UPI003715B306